MPMPASLIRQKASGFTMIEILVALLILAFGLLGMAGMTVLVMKGGRGAQDLADATNVCQQKIEELKDVDWNNLGDSTGADGNTLTWGVQNEAMAQEVDINPQGLTWEGLCNQQSSVSGSACNGVSSANCTSKAVGAACKDYLDAAGPYKFTRTFVVCWGEHYTTGGSGEPVPPAGSERGSAANPSLFSYSAGPNCIADPLDPTSRPQTLACESNDILTPGNNVPGASPEKMMKILCTWHSSEGACHYVNFEALRMNAL